MENNDSICYINKISSIAPIEGADKIELATVNGWTSVVAKGTHKVGDNVLCIITDAIIPEDLAVKWGVKDYLRKGFRVRTVKLRGVYSEAILIPLYDVKLPNPDVFDGQDLMKYLGIFKYEEPENTHVGTGTGQTRTSKNRTNQNFNRYYKFPNFKNVPQMFTEEDDVVLTRKMHGSNARYGILKKTKLSFVDRIKKFFGNKFVEYEYVYGSHNVQKYGAEPGYYKNDVWAEVATRYEIKDTLWKIAKERILAGTFEKGMIVYGEVFGPGIQGKDYSYGCDKVEFQAFDIELNDEYLSDEAFKALCPFPTVKVLYRGKWSKDVVDSFVMNQYIEGTKTPHEGVVAKCKTGNRKKVAKFINPDYHTYAEKHHVPDGH